jgi:hypothetical protein
MSKWRQSLAEIHSRANGKLTDKWDLYLDVYDQLLSSFRSKKISILEIGVQNGGSLETWGAFFENAEVIVGCDINVKCKELVFDDPRIHVIVGDATSKRTIVEVAEIAAHFNVIIEDGSHTSQDIIKSFCEYFPKVRPGGIYIAEDLHCCYWKNWGGGLAHPFSGMEFFKALCDCLNTSHWHRQDIQPIEYINTITAHYDFSVTNELLESIHSIEFFDSVCAIRKAENGGLSRLRERVIGGSEEHVASGHKEIDKLMPILPEENSRYTGLASLANEVERLALENDNLINDNRKLVTDLTAIRSSTSWRLTKPLRLIVNAAKSLTKRKTT